MLRRACLTVMLLSIPVLQFAQTKPVTPANKATPAPSIEGAWRIVQSTITGANASNNVNPQPSMIMFSRGYYSYVVLRSTAPRPVLIAAKDPANLTDAEKLARFEAWYQFSANSGTYDVVGNLLLRVPIVSKDPATMSIDPPFVTELKWEGDAVWFIARSNAGQPVSETRQKLVRMPAESATSPASPLTGTWKLNLAKSKYDPATTAPRSVTSVITVTSHVATYRSDGVNANGQATHGEWIARLDGKEYPQRNTLDGQIDPKGADSVIVRRIDANTYENINKRQGEVLTISRIVVSADGKSRTTTQTGKNSDGQATRHTLVWDRQ